MRVDGWDVRMSADLEDARDPRTRAWMVVMAVILVLGTGSRLFLYLLNGSFWIDEARIADHIQTHPLAELLTIPELAQPAPLGYFALLKLTTLLLGEGERVFRLPGLCCGIASLLVVAWWIRRACGLIPAVIGTGLLAASSFAVYYAVELRPYAVDLLVAVGILYLASGYLLHGDDDRRPAIGLVAIGFLGTWFSFPAVFVLAGVGSVILVREFRRGAEGRLRIWMIGIAGWVTSFVVHFAAFIRPLTEAYDRERFLTGQLGNLVHFPPLPPATGAEWTWWGTIHFGTVRNLLGIPAWVAVAVLAVALIGAVSGVRRTSLRPWILPVLSPLPFLLLASLLQAYPISLGMSRTLVFLLPSLLLCTATGVLVIGERFRGRAEAVVSTVLAALVLVWVIRSTWMEIERPQISSQARSVIRLMAAEWEAGDRVRITPNDRPVWAYYARRLDLPPGMEEPELLPYAAITSVESNHGIALEPGERLWAFISHPYPPARQRMQDFLVASLVNVARPEAELQRTGSGVVRFVGRNSRAPNADGE